MNIINKDLVIHYDDIVDNENYNNQDFYVSNVKRLRYKLNDLEFIQNNKFSNCFDATTLEIKNVDAWLELSKASHEELKKLVDDNDWDWLGDDFDDMQNYLSFVETHKPEVAFSFKTGGWKSDTEYMEIWAHDTTQFKTDAEREAYRQGLKDA
jgi:hypothetical protein